ncbi:MAG TPA: LytTR family DNA-binding domain-containing protein [Ohtaekwangia sp.]|nr:LytTR family DNA-binding domain-containing protein [Ohtaekwangia sp.]
MSKIKCIIVEDEPLAVRVLSDYISQVPFLELQQTFRDAILASEYLMNNQTDLMFLDIHLPKLKGMDFLRTLVTRPAVIVTTAYHQYAVEGFDLNVVDYLLKPIEFERFLAAVLKVKASQKSEKVAQPTEEKNYIFLNVQKKKVKILFEEVFYIESQREYVKVVTTKKEYLSKMSTHELEALLPSHQFKRVHRSFIVALKKIDSYTSDTLGINGVEIPIGREYRHVVDML